MYTSPTLTNRKIHHICCSRMIALDPSMYCLSLTLPPTLSMRRVILSLFWGGQGSTSLPLPLVHFHDLVFSDPCAKAGQLFIGTVRHMLYISVIVQYVQCSVLALLTETCLWWILTILLLLNKTVLSLLNAFSMILQSNLSKPRGAGFEPCQSIVGTK